MNAPFRLPSGGHIDRTHTLTFTFDGTEYAGHPGDTLASALLAHGVHHVATSITHGRPRGIVSAGAEEPSALVQITAPLPEPMLTATTVELYDGLAAHGLRGQRRLADEQDPNRYDNMHARCDILVVVVGGGGGPAGLAAALTAARAGARVMLVDHQAQLGGTLLGTAETLDAAPAVDWIAAVSAGLAAVPYVRVLTRTTAFGHYDDNLVLALEKRPTISVPPRPSGWPGSGSGGSEPGRSLSPPGRTSGR